MSNSLFTFSSFRTSTDTTTGPIAASKIIATAGSTATRGANVKMSIPRSILLVQYPNNPRLLCMARSLALTDGAPVSSWGSLIQATTSKQPIFYASGGFNGGQYVRFSATSSQCMYSPNASPIPMSCQTNNGFSLIVAVKLNNAGDWSRIYHGEPSTATSSDYMMLTKKSTVNALQLRYGNTGYLPANNGMQLPFTNNTWFVLSMRASPTYAEVRINNVVAYSITQNQPQANIALNFAMGANIYGQQPSSASGIINMDVAGLVMYDRYVSDGEMRILYGYMTQ